MGALILAGSGISWMLGGAVQQIALASGVAFLVSETVDALLYHYLRDRSWYHRVNGSNSASALVDSILFPWIAFGGVMPLITLGQWTAKVFGGAIWSWVLRPKRWVIAVGLLSAVVPIQAQTLSVGAGEFHNKFVTQTVIEAVVLSPKFLGFQPNAIISWDLQGDGRPVLLPQLGRDLPISNYPVIVGADVGVSAGPFDDYTNWEPHVSARVLAFIRGPLKAITIMSWQPWNDWSNAVVVKLDYTVW
tara:strand:- start:207 stop:947 length:741 start_codon:yes stop_codon:yes gene_type:complete